MTQKTALLIVDLQNDYFAGGKWELDKTQAAAANASRLLKVFRDHGWPVVHVRHEFAGDDAPFFAAGSSGAQIHDSVQPVTSEPVVVKQHINSFRETGLKEVLSQAGAGRLLIVGAMSHMCIDAVTRAAVDEGYECMVAHDACAARDLEFDGTSVPAAQVHAAFMAALAFGYAQVVTTDDAIRRMQSLSDT